MALPATLVWETRTTGNSANGGGFDASKSGTDYSQQDAAQVSYTDLVIGATTTNLTSAANPFTSAHVGNVISIASGTGFTAGYYVVNSVAGNVATMDRAVGTAASSGGVGKLGGAADSLSTVAGAIVASNVAWIKSGTYTATATILLSAISLTPSPTAPWTRIRGYGTTRGDGQRATISFTSGNLFLGNGWDVANLALVSGGTTNFVQIGNNSQISNCKVSGTYTTSGILVGNNSVVYGCEATGGTSAARGIQAGGSCVVAGNYVHDCLGTGVYLNGAGSVASRNLVVNNGKEGISVNNAAALIDSNTVHGNGLGGIVNYNASGVLFPVWNNILSANAGYGVSFAPSAGFAASVTTDGNAYYANTSGTRTNGSDTTVNPQSASGAYTNPYDQVLTGSPFVNAAGGDFRLNSTAGAGASCRGTGVPAAWTGSTLVGYEDMGAAQHQDSGSGGVKLVSMDGGV